MRKKEIMSENQDNNVYIPSEVLPEQDPKKNNPPPSVLSPTSKKDWGKRT